MNEEQIALKTLEDDLFKLYEEIDANKLPADQIAVRVYDLFSDVENLRKKLSNK